MAGALSYADTTEGQRRLRRPRSPNEALLLAAKSRGSLLAALACCNYYESPQQIAATLGGIRPSARDQAMSFGSFGPVQYVFWQIIVLLPLVIAVWLVFQIVGIRRSLERIARELKAKRVE